MAAPIGLRGDFGGEDLRWLARGSRDARRVRRLLALAVIHDGGPRAEAARMVASGSRSCGEEDRETVRWTASPTNGRTLSGVSNRTR